MSMNATESFAVRLRSFRERAELSVSELAVRAGLSRAAVYHLEAGDRQPSLEVAERLAVALGKKLRIFEGCFE